MEGRVRGEAEREGWEEELGGRSERSDGKKGWEGRLKGRVNSR